MEQEEYLKYVDDFRENHIPKKYNQIKLANDLLDPELDHYMSISNRADGKSFNYLHFFMNLAIDHGVGFTLVARHYTLQVALQQFIRKISDKSKIINEKDIQFMRTDFYIMVLWRDKQIGLITDLNKATDLKYHSNTLEDFPILIYDEFLALEGDYLPDEWEKLKTIYSSINRQDEDSVPLIKVPKLVYLGNAVNFSSPILAGLEMFNILEKHKINTVRKYGNILLEMNKNEASNEMRNLRAFNEKQDDMTSGKFTINYYQIANDSQRIHIKSNPAFITIKLDKSYLRIMYHRETFSMLLSVINFSDSYDFNLKLKDNTIKSVFLSEKYFDPKQIKKFIRGTYLFDNNFSKDFITEGFQNLEFLKINKIVREYELNNNPSQFEQNDLVYNENYKDRTKKALMTKFFD